MEEDQVDIGRGPSRTADRPLRAGDRARKAEERARETRSAGQCDPPTFLPSSGCPSFGDTDGGKIISPRAASRRKGRTGANPPEGRWATRWHESVPCQRSCERSRRGGTQAAVSGLVTVATRSVAEERVRKKRPEVGGPGPNVTAVAAPYMSAGWTADRGAAAVIHYFFGFHLLTRD